MKAAGRESKEKARSEPSVGSSKGSQGRTTATFEAYYWEAYNEIVEPRRWDHYLLRRWLPTLGPLGFTLVKVLRDRCYFNPDTGVLRDTCEVDMDELGRLVGVSRATLFRELGRNVALGWFVRRVEQYQMVNGRPQQTKNLYQVCMDDPVHPEDRERYEALRHQKETEREQPLPRKIVKQERPSAHESQNATHSKQQRPYESQSATHESQIETASLVSQFETASVSPYPSGNSFTKDSLTPAAAPSHSDPPRGDGESDSLAAVWNQALGLLAGRVNKPTLEAHLRPLRVASIADDGSVLLLAPHAATRDWIEKRHLPSVVEALGEVLGKSVTVCLRTAGNDKNSAVGS